MDRRDRGEGRGSIGGSSPWRSAATLAWWSSCVVMLAVLAVPIPASGWGDADRELEVGLSLGYAQYRDPIEDGTVAVHGADGAVRVRWGFDDALSIEAAVGWGGHAVPIDNGRLLRQAVTAAAGLRWAIDSFYLVPSLAVLVGGHLALQDVIIAPAFLLDFQVDLDWYLRPDWAIGFGFSYQQSFGPYGVPNRFVWALRASWRRLIPRRAELLPEGSTSGAAPSQGRSP